MMLEKLAGMGFNVSMPVNDQEDLELRVRPADRTEEEEGWT